MKATNYFVDVDGRTYRVALSPNGHPMIIKRRDRERHDTGPALDPKGRIGKKAVQAALEQAEHDKAH